MPATPGRKIPWRPTHPCRSDVSLFLPNHRRRLLERPSCCATSPSAPTCDDALRIVQEFVREGRYAGGGKWGTHWLFVDATWKILEISNNSREVTHAFHTQKAYFSRLPGNKAQKALQEKNAPVDFASFHNASRDSAICLKDSIAGMSEEIDRKHPATLSRAWVSLPAKALSFPLFIGGAETPLPLVNGEVFDTCHAIEGRREEWERIEAAAFRRQNALESEVCTLLQNRDLKQAATTIDTWTRQITTEHLAAPWLNLHAAESGLRIATFEVDVTPPLESPLCHRNVMPVKQIVTPLLARGLVILGSGQPIVLGARDWVALANASNVIIRETIAKAVGTTSDRVAVHTVHQHGAPGSDLDTERLLAEHGLGGRFSNAQLDQACFSPSPMQREIA